MVPDENEEYDDFQPKKMTNTDLMRKSRLKPTKNYSSNHQESPNIVDRLNELENLVFDV